MLDIERPEVRNLPESIDGLSPSDLLSIFRERLEKATNLREILNLQRGIVQLTAQTDPDLLDGLFGIRIVERAQSRPASESCTGYILGGKTDVFEFHMNMFKTHTVSQVPIPGAYAVYFLYEMDFGPTHIGRVTQNGSVISKWGVKGHVLEHPAGLVPLNYGEPLFYIPPAEQ